MNFFFKTDFHSTVHSAIQPIDLTNSKQYIILQLGSESILKSINEYDMRLWDYALSSLALRVPLIPSIVRTALEDSSVPQPVMSEESISSPDSTVKSKVPPSLNPLLQEYIGIFRPPGHKGPF